MSRDWSTVAVHRLGGTEQADVVAAECAAIIEAASHWSADSSVRTFCDPAGSYTVTARIRDGSEMVHCRGATQLRDGHGVSTVTRVGNGPVLTSLSIRHPGGSNLAPSPSDPMSGVVETASACLATIDAFRSGASDRDEAFDQLLLGHALWLIEASAEEILAAGRDPCDVGEARITLPSPLGRGSISLVADDGPMTMGGLTPSMFSGLHGLRNTIEVITRDATESGIPQAIVATCESRVERGGVPRAEYRLEPMHRSFSLDVDPLTRLRALKALAEHRRGQGA